MTTSKVEDARLRRVARRQGLVLQKSRRRDPRALDFGLYCIINPEHGGTIHADSVQENMYAAIDGLVDKLNRQVKRRKEKMTDHHARNIDKPGNR